MCVTEERMWRFGDPHNRFGKFCTCKFVPRSFRGVWYHAAFVGDRCGGTHNLPPDGCAPCHPLPEQAPECDRLAKYSKRFVWG